MFSSYKRNKVRQRIIERNGGYMLRPISFASFLCIIATPFFMFFVPVLFLYSMLSILLLVTIYAIMWFRMIRNMKFSKDRKFIRKMLKEDNWQKGE